MMTKCLSKLGKTAAEVGINPAGKYGKWFLAYSLVLLFLTYNSAFFVMYNWQNSEKRISGIEGLIRYLQCVANLFVILFCRTQFARLLKILHEGQYDFPFSSNPKRVALQQHIENGLIQFLTIWYNILDCIPIVMIAPCVISFIVQLGKCGISNIPISKLHLPEQFYFPKNRPTLTIYFAVFFIQWFMLVQSVRVSLVVLITPLILLQQVEGDLKLLKLAVEDSQTSFNCSNATKPETSKLIVQESYERKTPVKSEMKTFLIHFIHYHQYIYRKSNEVSRGIQQVSFSLNSGLSLLLCTSIYSITVSEEITIKIEQTIYTCALMYMLYCYHGMGEKVTIQDEKVRQAFYEMPWLEESLKFKKSFNFIMTRLTKPLEIQRIGIFSLNLQRFLAIVRAAYSLYNVLNSVAD